MMLTLLFWLSSGALAQDHHVVRPGETFEQIIEQRGWTDRAAEIRASSGLKPSQALPVGTVLQFPAEDRTVAGAICGLTGSAAVFSEDHVQSVAVKGQEVLQGHEVCTADDSFATVCLARDQSGFEHDSITLYPNTCLVVQASFSTDDRRASWVEMSKGALSVGNGADREPGGLTVKTPDGVITGDKGGYRVSIEKKGTRTEAVKQAVRVTGGEVEVVLEAGQGNRVTAGQAPTVATALLSGGVLATPDAGEQLRRPYFSWVSAERAVAYRVELASSADFVQLVYQDDVNDAEWRPSLLLLPYRVSGMWWRVSQIDRLGFVGEASEARPIRFPAGVGP